MRRHLWPSGAFGRKWAASNRSCRESSNWPLTGCRSACGSEVKASKGDAEDNISLPLLGSTVAPVRPSVGERNDRSRGLRTVLDRNPAAGKPTLTRLLFAGKEEHQPLVRHRSSRYPLEPLASRWSLQQPQTSGGAGRRLGTHPAATAARHPCRRHISSPDRRPKLLRCGRREQRPWGTSHHQFRSSQRSRYRRSRR